MVRTRLTLLFVLLVISELLASGFLLWTVDNSRYYIDRRRTSYNEVESYFTLARSAVQQWQVLGSLIEGSNTDPDPATLLRNGADEIERDINEMLAITRSEIALVRNRDTDIHLPEETRMTLMEEPTRKFIAGSRELADGLESGWDHDQVEAKAREMRPLIEAGLGPIIQSALLEERNESRDADSEAAAALSNLIVAALTMTGLGMVLGTVALYYLAQKVRKPMTRLLGGVHEFTQGHLDHRTDLLGDDEFAQLGQALDDMAAQLDRQRQELLHARNSLADTVAERTAELANANAELRKTDEVRREFLANVSHELRTPLTVIRGEADVTLRSGETIEEYRDALKSIVSQSGQMTKLVDDLLLIARSGAGALKLDLETVELMPLLEETARHAASLTRHETDIQLSGDEISADADRDRLIQLVMILLDNALRYAGAGVRIRIETRQIGDKAEIRIRDNGPGIPPEDIDHVFERFYRGGGSGRQEGSGLGLNIAKAIVDAHGGRIGIESEQGQGTTVAVALPAAAGVRKSA